ncbi:hypothetical protein [Corynebacterium sp.]|uniref:hypothetical protein n=1 Tax=Corynebacterium sp. TaxID=1720 RepID=UPI002A91E0E6|nr:hypothetical protein [Corynebacterium sp.]MDY5784811.1 hypothetical protein [Corynebacterium sp.]
MRRPRGEAVAGLIWLGVGAAVSVLMEVVYLNARLFGAPFPITIAVAFFFNSVLTRTAALWNPHPGIALIPLWVWLGCFFILMFALPAAGTMLVPTSLWTVLLLLAGIAGAVWPLVRPK